jgi:hypothetical protein
MESDRVFWLGKNALFKVVGGLAIVVIFFFGTLFLLDFADQKRSPEALRAANVRLVMDALQKYRAAKGAYPNLPDGPMTQLAAPLVDGGYLTGIPNDLGGSTNRYLSDGKSYGLRIARPTGGDCLVEVGITRTEWWGLTLPCNY